MGLIISGKMEKTIRLLDLKLDMLYPLVVKKKVSHENSFANFDGKK